MFIFVKTKIIKGMAERKEARVVYNKPVRRTKGVRNRSGHKVELVIEGRVVVFAPGEVVNVPMGVEIPSGLGLYVK